MIHTYGSLFQREVLPGPDCLSDKLIQCHHTGLQTLRQVEARQAAASMAAVRPIKECNYKKLTKRGLCLPARQK